MSKIFINTSRIFLGVYFLITGMGKFIYWDTHMELMAAHNMILIPFFLAIAGISQVIGSICILINKQVVFCTLYFALMVLIINFNLHDFWNVYPDVDTAHETQNFIKNLGVVAAFLLLAAVHIDNSVESYLK
ncbi:DoxX family protein [Pseudomonadota bacterium]|nr:DoxX family protein [Pseudomonadota bacterium]